MGGDTPKQYLEVAGRSLLEHSLSALLACEQVTAVCVALHPGDERAGDLELLAGGRVRTVQGASERSGSVLAALDGLAADAANHDWVLVHDAARPCVRPADIEALITSVCATGIGGLLAEPVVDTVKEAGPDDLVTATLDRERLWRAQTPQMFRFGELREALLAAVERGATVTDEAAAMELAGHRVQLVPGPRGNLKVTVPADLPLAAWYLERAGTD